MIMLAAMICGVQSLIIRTSHFGAVRHGVFVDYENFSKYKELRCGFKNAKKIKKIVLGTISKYFLKIGIYFVFWKNWG